MKKTFQLHIVALLIVTSGYFYPLQFVRAGEVDVVNNVNVSATTGGNSAGTVKNGTAKTEVHIEQTINGEDLDPVDVRKDSDTGNASVNVKLETTADDNSITTHSEITTNGHVEEQEKEYEVSGNEQGGATRSETEQKENKVEIIGASLDALKENNTQTPPEIVTNLLGSIGMLFYVYLTNIFS